MRSTSGQRTHPMAATRCAPKTPCANGSMRYVIGRQARLSPDPSEGFFKHPSAVKERRYVAFSVARSLIVRLCGAAWRCVALRATVYAGCGRRLHHRLRGCLTRLDLAGLDLAWKSPRESTASMGCGIMPIPVPMPVSMSTLIPMLIPILLTTLMPVLIHMPFLCVHDPRGSLALHMTMSMWCASAPSPPAVHGPMWRLPLPVVSPSPRPSCSGACNHMLSPHHCAPSSLPAQAFLALTTRASSAKAACPLLQSPGADVVVLDEGHRIKNARSKQHMVHAYLTLAHTVAYLTFTLSGFTWCTLTVPLPYVDLTFIRHGACLGRATTSPGTVSILALVPAIPVLALGPVPVPHRYRYRCQQRHPQRHE